MRINKIFLLIILIITSCSDDIKNENLNNLKDENYLNLTINQNDLSFNLKTANNEINYETHIVNNNISSKLTILNSNDKSEHTINYSFNINNEHWKLKQEEKVIEKAKELVSINLKNENIQEILNELENFHSSYSQKILAKSNPFLLSSLSYHKSILSSASRAIINNTECDCNVHPAFLIDKTNFNCQEEQFIKTNELKKYYRIIQKRMKILMNQH